MNSIMSLSSVIEGERCGRKGFLRNNNISYSKNKNYLISQAMKKVLSTVSIESNSEEIRRVIKEEVSKEGDLFISNFEMEAEIEKLVVQLERYYTYEYLLGRNIIKKNVIENVSINNLKIKVNAEYIIDNGYTIEVIKFKRKEPKLSYKGRNKESNPQNSLELFMLQKLGEKLYPDRNIIASLYYLKSKNDKGDTFEPKFEAKKGKNIIQTQFKEEEYNDLIERICNIHLSFKDCKRGGKECTECEYNNICNHENKKVDFKIKKLETVESFKKKIKLTKTQEEMRDYEEGFVRTNAVAGSGKTQTSSERICELLEKGYSPKKILLITFTETGKGEMIEKIKKTINRKNIKVNIRDLEIKTFNGWGQDILNKYYHKVGFNVKPAIIDNVEKYEIIIKLLEDTDRIPGMNYNNPLLNMLNAKGVIIEISTIIDKIKSYSIRSIEEFLKYVDIDKEIAEQIFSLYQEYEKIQINRGLIQYEDQINYILKLFNEYPEILKEYQYVHILVDEYQDTDCSQLEVIKMLTKNKLFKSLMVIGDDMQSIFSFRNTSQKNILDFDKMFPNVKDIFLCENFRSTPEICECANKLIDVAAEKIDKKIVSTKPHGKEIEYLLYDNVSEEYKFIASDINRRIQEGEQPSNIAILARTRKELLEIEKALIDENNKIPYTVSFSENILDNSLVKNAIDFSNFFKDFSNDASILNYLTMLNEGEIDIFNDILSTIKTVKESLINSYTTITEESEKLQYVYNLLSDIGKKDKDNVFFEFINNLQSKEFNSIDELLLYLNKIKKYSSPQTIEKRADEIQAITLITAHSSKGKEYKIVYNTINKYKYTASEREETRRLLYVSITRAQDELLMTYSQKESLKKDSFIGFLKELSVV